MATEKATLMSLLKMTKTSPVSRSALVKATRLPSQIVERALKDLAREELFKEYSGIIEASPIQRVRLVISALRLGADFERVCDLLSWAEFEIVASQAFEANGYQVVLNFHFKNGAKRWEIDVVSSKKPVILCVDCKHWKRGWRSAATAKAATAQAERTSALADALPKYAEALKIADWRTVKLAPLILSLIRGPHKFYNGVPIVPILQLQDFINGVSVESDFMQVFMRNLHRQDYQIDMFR